MTEAGSFNPCCPLKGVYNGIRPRHVLDLEFVGQHSQHPPFDAGAGFRNVNHCGL